MDKTGEIREGATPPEDDNQKMASADALAEHVTKRAADAAQKAIESSEN